MKDNEFETIWQEHILPNLKEMETARSRERWQLIWALFFPAAAAIVYVGKFSGTTWLFFLGFLLCVCLGELWRANSNEFRKKFKQHVLQAVADITAFPWQLSDDISADESKAVYHDSSLYHEENLAKTDDVLTAAWESAQVSAHEIKVEVSTWKNEITVSQRFILKIDISYEFRGKTFVQTESDSGFFSSGVGGVLDWETDVEETELEWGEFEQFLVVQSSDPSEAREIFTPDFMQALYGWWRDHDESLRLAFKNNSVYIAVPTDTDLEPRVFGDLQNERSAVREILEFLLFAEEVTKLMVGNRHLHR